MAVEVRFSAQASIELDKAIAWYESQKQNLGLEFMEAVENAVSAIAKNPDRFPSPQLRIGHFRS